MAKKMMAAAFAALGFMGMAAYAAEDAPAKDIVDTAAGIEDFSTLVAAVKAGGLVDTLKGEGPFTVFAPTNAAFKKLGTAVDDLLKPENKDKLVAILKYHVVAGKVMAADAKGLAGKSAKTVEGREIKISLDGETVKINESKVTKADVACKNGVVHIIDAVLMPPAKE